MRQTVKTLAKGLLAGAASRLPPGGREAVFQRLGSYAQFARLAERYHVVDLSVRGEYGTFRSAVDDTSVLASYAQRGRWSEHTVERFQHFFERRGGGTYVDVGANVGLTVVPIAANPAVHAHAVEPEPVNYKHLVENVERNCAYGNVVTHQIAAFHERTTVRFELAAGNLGDHRIRRTDERGELREEQRRTIDVPAEPLDDIVGPTEGAVAIKIDTQGAEPFVIAGASRLLHDAELVVLEFWPYGITRMGGDPELIYKFILSGFSECRLARGDEGEPGAPVAPDAAVEQLRTYFQLHQGTEKPYFELIATR